MVRTTIAVVWSTHASSSMSSRYPAASTAWWRPHQLDLTMVEWDAPRVDGLRAGMRTAASRHSTRALSSGNRRSYRLPDG